MIAAKHYKYNYHPLISPKIFFEKMVQSNNEFEENSFENDFYISMRIEIITLLKNDGYNDEEIEVLIQHKEILQAYGLDASSYNITLLKRCFFHHLNLITKND